jgi:hypothetical protein
LGGTIRWKNGLAADADNKSVDVLQVMENPNPVGCVLLYYYRLLLACSKQNKNSVENFLSLKWHEG